MLLFYFYEMINIIIYCCQYGLWWGWFAFILFFVSCLCRWFKLSEMYINGHFVKCVLVVVARLFGFVCRRGMCFFVIPSLPVRCLFVRYGEGVLRDGCWVLSDVVALCRAWCDIIGKVAWLACATLQCQRGIKLHSINS